MRQLCAHFIVCALQICVNYCIDVVAFVEIIPIQFNSCAFVIQMMPSYALRLHASLLILLFSGQMNAHMGPAVDFNAQSFHWTIEDIANNAGFDRMEVRWLIGDANSPFCSYVTIVFPKLLKLKCLTFTYTNVATTEMFETTPCAYF